MVTPATRSAEGRSATLATLLKALKALAPDDPAWDEFNDWIEDLRDCADEAATARVRLREEASLRERLSRWTGEFAEVAKAFTHPVPTWEQLRGLSLIEVATRMNALFEVYALFVALNARPPQRARRTARARQRDGRDQAAHRGSLQRGDAPAASGAPASSPPQASPTSAATAPSPFDVPVPPAPVPPAKGSPDRVKTPAASTVAAAVLPPPPRFLPPPPSVATKGHGGGLVGLTAWPEAARFAAREGRGALPRLRHRSIKGHGSSCGRVAGVSRDGRRHTLEAQRVHRVVGVDRHDRSGDDLRRHGRRAEPRARSAQAPAHRLSQGLSLSLDDDRERAPRPRRSASARRV